MPVPQIVEHHGGNQGGGRNSCVLTVILDIIETILGSISGQDSQVARIIVQILLIDQCIIAPDQL